MRLSYDLIGDKDLRAELEKYAKKKPIAIKKETYAHGLDIMRKAKQNLKDMKKWDTGNAANSMMMKLENAGFSALVGPTAPYAVYIESGARPHMPPVDALEGWAKRHGFDSAWPIALAIAKRGIPETPFLAPAFQDVEKEYYKALIKLLKE